MAYPATEIRVVIPAYRSGKTLISCVHALIESLKPFLNPEIVIVDNGGNAGLEDILKTLPIKILSKYKISGAAYARNEGAKGFYNGILIFIDADVICEPDTITNLIEPLLSEECVAACGNYSTKIHGLTFSQTYKQLYIHHIYNRKGTELKNYFWTAISAVNAGVFHKLNGFDEGYEGAKGEDQEFGFRLTRNNYKVYSVKNARGQHLNNYNLFGIIKNDFKKGISAIENSIQNKVALTYNQHAKFADMTAVICAVFSLISFVFIYYSPFILLSAILFFTGWVISRFNLVITYIRYTNFLFTLKAILLMYVLDLIRFGCVVAGVFKNLFTHPVSESKRNPLPSPAYEN